MANDSSSSNPETPASGTDNTDATQTHHKLFSILTDDFGKVCVDQNVQTAIAIAVHPDHLSPIIFVRGHKYEIAKILARVLASLKHEIMSELNSD